MSRFLLSRFAVKRWALTLPICCFILLFNLFNSPASVPWISLFPLEFMAFTAFLFSGYLLSYSQSFSVSNIQRTVLRRTQPNLWVCHSIYELVYSNAKISVRLSSAPGYACLVNSLLPGLIRKYSHCSPLPLSLILLKTSLTFFIAPNLLFNAATRVS